MAEITPDSSLAEVINSLDLAVVPEKLHCSTCHGFLLNAYKTSCCEQNVCEKCFNQIADHCPMCKHKPFSKELCRPAKAMRNTVKAYVRNIEKNLADDRSKLQVEQAAALETVKPKVDEVAEAQAEANREIENGTTEKTSTKSEEPTQDVATSLIDVQPSIEVAAAGNDFGEAVASPTNDEIAKRQLSVESDANDDEVEIQVEPSAEDDMLEMPQTYEMDEQEQAYGNAMLETSKNGDSDMHNNHNGMDSNGFNMQNMNMTGFNNMGMDLNMMQQMMNMNMNQMMSMGVNPMMFNGFGGSNGNMNGMNMMGMNLNPNQMFNGYGQNSNIWQNNNAMTMGGDFGSHFGSNMSQQGNFYPQQFANGDFNGYNSRPGRGRFRGGRGSYNRGRGSYNQYQQNYGQNNAQDQQQYESQNSPAQIIQNSSGQTEIVKNQANTREEDVHDQDDFAPGGQDEVQEALGDSGQDQDVKENEPESEKPIVEVNGLQHTLPEVTPIVETEKPATQEKSELEKIIPEAYHEDFDSMAPPTAPTGPSGRYSDKEFAFRARGHGKYSSRARGSFSTSTPSAGIPQSPIRSVSQSSAAAPSPPAKGIGVVGAPTGPRAMREPPAPKSTHRPATNSGGFQIMGRASMQPQTSQAKEDERPRSATPTNGHDTPDDNRVSSRSHSKYDKYNEPNPEASLDSNYDNDRSDRDRDRRSKRSKRSEYQDDYEMRDVDRDDDFADRRSSYRNSRHDKERTRKEDKYSSSKHRSSGRHYDDEAESEYDKDDYGESPVDKHRSSRSRKSSSKYDVVQDKERDSHRDRKRDRDRERDRDRDRDRGDDKSKDKDDRHRKRSRHDRDREDEYDDPDDDESRHRSRRHKRDHHTSGSRRDKDKEADDPELGLRISGRSSINRSSALPTPTSATSPLPSTSITNTEKDPNTLEREARNRERMLKEQQRREKAALDKRGGSTASKTGSRTATSGGRRVSYKYEDEVERGLGAADEREKARWR